VNALVPYRSRNPDPYRVRTLDGADSITIRIRITITFDDQPDCANVHARTLALTLALSQRERGTLSFFVRC
jgi:hypothetical protein